MKKPDIPQKDRAQPEITEFNQLLLRVETTSKCNRACRFCPHRELKRPKEFMSWSLYNKIVEDAHSLGITSMDIRNFGEPLLDLDLEHKIAYAKKRDFRYIEIYTNGILLNSDRYKSLIDAGIDRIRTSVITDQEYNTALLRNLSDIDLRNDNIVSVELINMPETAGNYIFLLKRLMDLGVKRVRLVPPHNWGNWKKVALNNKDLWCHRLWSSINILTNGQTVLCCMDYEGIYDLGNVSTQHLGDIINSDRFIQYRQNHLNRSLEPICKECEKPTQDAIGLPIEVFLKGIEI